LFRDGDEQVHRHRNPDLSFDGILIRAIKRFDSQVLFDPFEKQFDLPARFVQRSDRRDRQVEVVG